LGWRQSGRKNPASIQRVVGQKSGATDFWPTADRAQETGPEPLPPALDEAAEPLSLAPGQTATGLAVSPQAPSTMLADSRGPYFLVGSGAMTFVPESSSKLSMIFPVSH
jgi:hypothetical protein